MRHERILKMDFLLCEIISARVALASSALAFDFPLLIFLYFSFFVLDDDMT